VGCQNPRKVRRHTSPCLLDLRPCTTVPNRADEAPRRNIIRMRAPSCVWIGYPWRVPFQAVGRAGRYLFGARLTKVPIADPIPHQTTSRGRVDSQSMSPMLPHGPLGAPQPPWGPVERPVDHLAYKGVPALPVCPSMASLRRSRLKSLEALDCPSPTLIPAFPALDTPPP